ncbi:MAG: general secretion pathway protein GspD [Rhodoferax sp.]|nr:general secretion pathway protein GspD [Rhodoferax sp.]
MTYRLSLISLLLILVGCATGQDAFKRGQDQLVARQWEPALLSFFEASQQAPSNAEYSAAVKTTRERAISVLLTEAAEQRDKQPAKAAEIYQRILLLNPSNERAQEGLQAIDSARRQQRLFDDASRAAATGRDQEARAKFSKLLAQAPGHAAARLALRALDDKAGRSNSQPSLSPALRKPVSMVFRDATLKMVFDALASSTGINVVFDRDLKQDTRVTVLLRDVAFDEALTQITHSNGLATRVVNANTLLVYPARPDKVKEYQDLTVRNFFVANADVKQLSILLKTVLKIKDLYTDDKRNLIVIRDTPEQVAMAEKMIAAHDQPEPEVMLEVEILEFNHTTDNNLGLKFPDQIAFGVANPITLNALRAINDTAINVSGLDSAIAINLKRQLGDINILANPRIRVRNREKAKFHIGDKVPVITSTTYPGTTTGATSSSVSYLDVGIKLEFEPSIQLDDDVIIKTVLEVSSITNTVVNSGTTAYQVGTRNATTTLTLRDGETQVLAGLLSTDEANTSNRLPGLGDIPVLGNLFSSHVIKGGRKEILLSITPRIVRNLHRPTDDLLEFNFGPESGQQGGTGQGGVVLPQPIVQAQRPVLPQPIPRSPVNGAAGAANASGLVPMVPFGAAPVQTPVLPQISAPSTPAATSAPPVDFELPPGVGSR